MELLQLKYFIEVAESEYLTKTAEKMMVSPSVVSNSISRLEKELNVQLFDRVGRNIRLNKFGKVYYKHISAALDEIAAARHEVSNILNSSNQTVSVASWNPGLIQTPVSEFRSQYPDINYKHIHFDPVASPAFSNITECDFVIAATDAFNLPGWEKEVFFKDCILLAVSPTHRLANRKSVDLIELKDEQFVTISVASFSRKCAELCNQVGFTPKSRIECDFALRPKIILSENMVAITTYMAKISGIYSGISLIKIDNPPYVREQAIYWKDNRSMSDAAKKFKQFFIDYYKEYDSSIV